jgi:hypothetical protein
MSQWASCEAVITAAIRAGADCIPKHVKLHLAQFAHQIAR